MLQFFKKSGQREKSRLSQSSPIKCTRLEKFYKNVTDPCASTVWFPSVSYSLEEEEKEVLNNDENNVCSFRSQLSKTLAEVLADKGALGYFIQFLDTRKAICLIKFWLEVECLRGSFLNSWQGEDSTVKNNEFLGKNSSSLNLSASLDDNDNFDCHVLTGCTDNHYEAEQEEVIYDKSIVNSDDVKSNCDDMPKISLVLSTMRQSNPTRERRKNDTTTIRQDALRIYKRYIIKDALGCNRIPEELKTETEKAFSGENMGLILKCLTDVQTVVFNILEKEHINDFLRSEFHCKHQIDVLTSGNVQLADILYNETALFYFMEFMELENKRELLDFWMAAVSYKQNLVEKKDSTTSEEAQSDALIIYDKYFSLQATVPLGFSDRIRFQVEQNICREDGEGPQSDCFDRPCKIVYKFLNKHYLPPFLSSQLYYKYLSELINTIQSNPCSVYHPRIKRAGSDCSSEVSSLSNSMQGTLQAGSEGNGIVSTKSSTGNSMSIDTRQLYDPDSLWRRNKYRLSVGYIDYLGRFITEIEPDPCRKYESRLARAVKRFVNMERDKAKEELAWKIAEMIVRDITSLTLGAANPPS